MYPPYYYERTAEILIDFLRLEDILRGKDSNKVRLECFLIKKKLADFRDDIKRYRNINQISHKCSIIALFDHLENQIVAREDALEQTAAQTQAHSSIPETDPTPSILDSSYTQGAFSMYTHKLYQRAITALTAYLDLDDAIQCANLGDVLVEASEGYTRVRDELHNISSELKEFGNDNPLDANPCCDITAMLDQLEGEVTTRAALIELLVEGKRSHSTLPDLDEVQEALDAERLKFRDIAIECRRQVKTIMNMQSGPSKDLATK